jgi:hypothetical protein
VTQPQDDVFEMLWDCRYCGQKKLLGLTHRFCPGCGAPQDPAARYFPSDAEKVPVRAPRFVGADVTCPACRTPSSRAAQNCGHCGSPLAQGAAVATKGAQVQSAPGAAWQPQAAFGASPPPKPAMATTTKVLLGLAGAALLAIVALVVIAATWKKSSTYAVLGHTWERNVSVETFGPVKKSDWCDALPSGARTLRRTSAQRGSEKIPDGQECRKIRKDQGDGTFKEVTDCKPKFKERPVMADKCDYEVDQWSPSRTLTASGADLDPRWPDTSGLRAGTCQGCERPGSRSERYTLRLRGPKGEDDLEECDVPETRWRAIPDKSRWRAKVGVLTGKVDCDSLERP